MLVSSRAIDRLGKTVEIALRIIEKGAWSFSLAGRDRVGHGFGGLVVPFWLESRHVAPS